MMLHQVEQKILSVLSERMPASEVAQKAGLPISSVLSFAQSLKEKSYVTLESEEQKSLSLTPEGKRYISEGLPEERVHLAAISGAPISHLSPEEKSIGLVWARKNGWVGIGGGMLKSEMPAEQNYSLRAALGKVERGESIAEEESQLLMKRKLVQQSVSKTTYLSPAAVQPMDEAAGSNETNAITRELLLSGKWRALSLRPYDVSSPAEIPYAAKRHMISRLQARIRRIFSDMGFEVMNGPEIQGSFWNFDALFQPQDHPARDLADTFYMEGASPLPDDAELISKIKKVHERSWGGQWTEENASRAVLRTHTTAVSARYLYEKCKDGAPKKYFSIGKVYRNEATDYKHLAEFFQVEGIVVWEGATFRDLLGCLKEFYSRLGFEKIRFQPSYFPYTEPSLEISVYFEEKKQWLELGGAGIFRPEVSIPLCDRYPVLAWGLSLERPLMLLNDMDDIRTFYRNNLGWIRKQKLK